MAKKTNPAAVGAFVVGAVALAALTAVILGSGRLFRETHDYVLFFTGDVNGLRVGAPVKFKGVEIGQVKKILLNLRLAKGTAHVLPSAGVNIPVVIEVEQGRLVKEGAAELDLDDPEVMKQMIASGLRAHLAMESFVTGMLYVDLDFYPGSQAHMVLKPGAEYEEIPTVPTALEQAQKTLNRVLQAVGDVDFRTMVVSATETAHSIKDLVTSPELKRAIGNLNRTADNLNQTATSIRQVAQRMNQELGPLGQSLRQTSKSADTTFKQANATLGDMHAILNSDSELLQQTNQTLENLSSAARAVRELAQYLERNPSAVVRGRYHGEDAR